MAQLFCVRCGKAHELEKLQCHAQIHIEAGKYLGDKEGYEVDYDEEVFVCDACGALFVDLTDSGIEPGVVDGVESVDDAEPCSGCGALQDCTPDCEVAASPLLSECQNCGTLWEEAQLVNPVPDLEQRVAPGEPMPSGECPACGAVCQEEPKAPWNAKNEEFEVEIEATSLPGAASQVLELNRSITVEARYPAEAAAFALSSFGTFDRLNITPEHFRIVRKVKVQIGPDEFKWVEV